MKSDDWLAGFSTIELSGNTSTVVVGHVLCCVYLQPFVYSVVSYFQQVCVFDDVVFICSTFVFGCAVSGTGISMTALKLCANQSLPPAVT